MDLETRMSNIVKIMNETDKNLSAREIAAMYVAEPTSSDALTTGSILNVMALLGLVTKHSFWAGKSVRYRFARKGNHMITMVNDAYRR